MKDEEFREKIAEIKRIQEANDLTIKNTAEDIKRQHDEISKLAEDINRTHERIVGKKPMGIIEDLASKIAQLEVAVQTNATVIAAETTRAETAEKQVEHAIQRADARAIIAEQQAIKDLTDEISFVKGRLLDHLALFGQLSNKLQALERKKIVGVADRIVVTETDMGTIVDIAPTYAGQASIKIHDQGEQ